MFVYVNNTRKSQNTQLINGQNNLSDYYQKKLTDQSLHIKSQTIIIIDMKNQNYTEEWKYYCRRLGTTEIIHCELVRIL